MRFKKAFNRNQSIEIESKSVDDFFNEFITLFNTKIGDSSNLAEQSNNITYENNNSSDNNIKKCEYLKCFLIKLKKVYSFSSKDVKLTEEYKTEFKSSLYNKCKQIVVCITLNLIQLQSVALRVISLSLLLFLSHLKKFHVEFQQLNISIYVIRIIDLDLTTDESALCLDYIRLLAQFYPDCINETHFYCLISFLEKSNDKLNNLTLEVILELICKRPKLACECQVFTDLTNYIVNACNEENQYSIELIIQSLFKVIENFEYRNYIQLQDLLKILIAPLIDCDYTPLIYGPTYSANKSSQQEAITICIQNIKNDKIPNENDPKIEKIMNSCYIALNCIFNNFIGMLCFSSNDHENLKILLSPLSWFLNSNKRDSEKWYSLVDTLNSNEEFTNSCENKPQNDKNQQISNRQFLIIEKVINFIHRLFKIEEINIIDLSDKNKSRFDSRSLSVCSNPFDFIDEDFINSECNDLFYSVENFSSQSNIENLDYENKSKSFSTNANLTLFYRSFVLKSFIEAGIFESLLDLYFGLPVSFLQNYSFGKSENKSPSFYNKYQLISLKCLNLFAELFHLANTIFHNEYCIDDFKTNKSSTNTFKSDEGVYNEMKRLLLISYLKQLNDIEREKEVITYLTEFNTKKESVKNGVMLPGDLLAKLSFYSHQFLANSYYLNSKKYQIELEILNSKTNQYSNQKSFNTSSSVFDLVSDLILETATKDKRENKKQYSDIEKKFDEALDFTLVLQYDSNISFYENKQNQLNQYWNWFEILKIFENFLLTSSSMHPRFFATQDSLFIDANKKLFLNDNPRLIKFIKKLFDFFLYNNHHPNNEFRLSSSPSKLSLNKQQFSNQTLNNGLTNCISCSGCYLIDFILSHFNMDNINEKILGKVDVNRYSSFEYLLIQFVQNMKLYLLSEFPNVNCSNASSSRNRHNKNISKDSLISYYILFLGHLSSNSKGDFILESFKLYDLIIKIIETYRDVSIMKLIISSFNFYTSTKSRLVLEKSLCQPLFNLESDELKDKYIDFKFFASKLILNIFRANKLKFEVCFVDVLFKSFLDIDSQGNIKNYNAITWESNCALNQFYIEYGINLIEYLINQRPDFVDSLLIHDILIIERIKNLRNFMAVKKHSTYFKNYKVLDLKLSLLYFRFKLSSSNLNKLNTKEIVDLIEEWDNQNLDVRYFELIETYLLNSLAINPYFIDELNEIENKSNEYLNDFFDLNNPSSPSYIKKGVKLYRKINYLQRNGYKYQDVTAELYLPFHINTALMKLEKILEVLILNEKFKQKLLMYFNLLKDNVSCLNHNSTKKQIKNLKAALWAVSSMCVCENGFQYISIMNKNLKIFKNLFEFIKVIIKITEEHSSISIRASGFYCLNLISKSCTGANLIGKLGWHTFQPNIITPVKAFYSILNSLSNEQEISIYSSIETALQLFNINRSKPNIILKEIKKYFYCNLTNYEKEFLNQAIKFEVFEKSDDYFIKLYDRDKIGYFFENISVPIRTGLLSVETNSNEACKRRIFKTKELDEKPLVNNYFLKYLENNNFLLKNKNIKNDLMFKKIIEIFNELVPWINVDKKLSTLIKYKQSNLELYDLFLHYNVTYAVLSKFKIKFKYRKLIQELFNDSLSINYYRLF